MTDPPLVPANEVFSRMDRSASCRDPFFFAVDYEKTYGLFCPVDKTALYLSYKMPDDFLKHQVRSRAYSGKSENVFLSKDKKTFGVTDPVSFEVYRRHFENVQRQQKSGNSYLLNLTFATKIQNFLTLHDIYKSAIAPYKFFLPGCFTVFSPERFVRISKGLIETTPMKGTSRSGVAEDAGKDLLSNQKELCEHITIVDLMRNDLGLVSSRVQVTDFRYVDKIYTNRGIMYQTSSRIQGRLKKNLKDQPGSVFNMLLPAGSVTGAPKKKTCEIIHDEEAGSRGFYTGVFGVYDGLNLDSAVMIRFVEKKDGKYYYRSGGGITVYSNVNDEYQELLDKIYLPGNHEA